MIEKINEELLEACKMATDCLVICETTIQHIGKIFNKDVRSLNKVINKIKQVIAKAEEK